jgi:hypothetical protein
MAGIDVRTLVVGAIGLALGGVLGGLPARSQLRQLQEEVDTLRKTTRPAVGRELGQILRGGLVNSPGQTPVPDAPPPPTAEPVQPVEPPAQDAPVAGTNGADGGSKFPKDLPKELDTAKAALEMRAAQARAALLEDADPTPQQLEQIDASLASMNEDLRRIAEDVAAELASGVEPDRRQMMMIAADTLDVMVDAETRLSDALTPEQIDGLEDDSLNPFSYVDPTVLQAFDGLGQ